VALSFLECYEVLDITDESDWIAIRKKYKSLIQQCHPDRFLDNAEDLKKAEENIRRYNAAFKTISDYYQSTKTLPPRTDFIINTKPTLHEPRKKPPPVKPVYPDQKKSIPTQQDSHLSTIRFSLITISIFGLILFLIYHYEAQPPQQQKVAAQMIETSPNPIPSIKASQIKEKTETTKQKKPIIQFFSIGSGIGEVILAQGGPTHIDNNVWYYGKSTVTFHDGVVTDWYRHPDHPLNAEIKHPKEYKSKFLELEKSPTIKEPYWNRNR